MTQCAANKTKASLEREKETNNLKRLSKVYFKIISIKLEDFFFNYLWFEFSTCSLLRSQPGTAV